MDLCCRRAYSVIEVNPYLCMAGLQRQHVSTYMQRNALGEICSLGKTKT